MSRRSALILLVAAVVAGLWACAPAATPAPTPPLAVRVTLPEGDVGVSRSDTALALYAAEGAGPFAKLTATEDAGGRPTVHLFSNGGDTGRSTNTFVFGYAPPAATSVEVGPGQVVSEIRQGIFLAALAAKDVTPAQLTWAFRDASGAVVAEGAGILD